MTGIETIEAVTIIDRTEEAVVATIDEEVAHQNTVSIVDLQHDSRGSGRQILIDMTSRELDVIVSALSH